MPAEQLHFIMPCSLIKRYSFVIFAYFDFLFVNYVKDKLVRCVVSSLYNITHIVHNPNAIWTVHQNFVINTRTNYCNINIIIKLAVHNNPLKTVTTTLGLALGLPFKHHGVKNSAINDVTLNLQILRTSDLSGILESRIYNNQHDDIGSLQSRKHVLFSPFTNDIGSIPLTSQNIFNGYDF
jgi:hypothetical protein